MLYEVKKVKQEPGEGKKRWFTDDYFDLFIWIDEDGVLSSFQLSYDKGHDERVVTWTRKGGIRHTGVDDGESNPLSSMTPLLRTDGVFANSEIAEKFRRESGHINPKLADFVYKKIREFPPDRNS